MVASTSGRCASAFSCSQLVRIRYNNACFCGRRLDRDGVSLRSSRLARDARFPARDPNQELPVYDPDKVLERLNKTLRRRLSDRIEAVFEAACITGGLETAADLLVVLGNVRSGDIAHLAMSGGSATTQWRRHKRNC